MRRTGRHPTQHLAIDIGLMRRGCLSASGGGGVVKIRRTRPALYVSRLAKVLRSAPTHGTARTHTNSISSAKANIKEELRRRRVNKILDACAELSGLTEHLYARIHIEITC
jgi:hypothetical protein